MPRRRWTDGPDDGAFDDDNLALPTNSPFDLCTGPTDQTNTGTGAIEQVNMGSHALECTTTGDGLTANSVEFTDWTMEGSGYADGSAKKSDAACKSTPYIAEMCMGGSHPYGKLNTATFPNAGSTYSIGGSVDWTPSDHGWGTPGVSNTAGNIFDCRGSFTTYGDRSTMQDPDFYTIKWDEIGTYNGDSVTLTIREDTRYGLKYRPSQTQFNSGHGSYIDDPQAEGASFGQIHLNNGGLVSGANHVCMALQVDPLDYGTPGDTSWAIGAGTASDRNPTQLFAMPNWLDDMHNWNAVDILLEFKITDSTTGTVTRANNLPLVQLTFADFDSQNGNVWYFPDYYHSPKGGAIDGPGDVEERIYLLGPKPERVLFAETNDMILHGVDIKTGTDYHVNPRTGDQTYGQQCVGEFTADNSNDPLYAPSWGKWQGRPETPATPRGTRRPKRTWPSTPRPRRRAAAAAPSERRHWTTRARGACSTAQSPARAATTRPSRST